MRVLITGGAGFLGSHLAERLRGKHELLVLDNFSTGQTRAESVEIIEGDVGDAHWVVDQFRPDVIAHAAASYADPDNWQRDLKTNARGTAAVVRSAQKCGVERIVYFQTALCYGTKPLEQPITLDHPIRPDSSYAISKTAGEQYIQLSGIDYVSLRLANAYGPRNLTGPVPAFYKRLMAGEPCFVADTRRDFVFVDDIIDVVEMAVEGKGSGVYHVSSGRDTAIKDVHAAVSRALDIEPDAEVKPRTDDDAATILLDPTRTNEDFGWSPSVPLEDGIARAVAWYREHGVRDTYTHLKVPA